MIPRIGAAAVAALLCCASAGCGGPDPVPLADPDPYPKPEPGTRLRELSYRGATYKYYVAEGTGMEITQAIFVVIDGIPRECPTDVLSSCGPTISEALRSRP